MIALNLFDMLADFADASPSDKQVTRVHHAAIGLLTSLLLEWNQLRELEAETGRLPGMIFTPVFAPDAKPQWLELDKA